MEVKVNGKPLNIKDCRPLLRAAKGLMFSSLRNIDGALIRGNSIWMPFCKPLTLIFLDKDYNLLKHENAESMTLNPKTWKIYKCSEAKYCLEINPNKIKERIKSVSVKA